MKFIILLFAALFVAANCQFDSIVQVPVDSEVSKSLTLWATEALSNFNGVKYTLSRIIEVKSQQAAKGLKLMIKAEYSFINSMKQQKVCVHLNFICS